MWLQGSSNPTGLAKERRQSERSVDSFSYRLSVATRPGRCSTSESVCRHSRLSPIRISSAESDISCKQAVSFSDREKYFSTSPEEVSVPTISSVERRLRRTKPLSFMIRSNCSVASMNLATASLSRISFGIRKPRHRVLKLLKFQLTSLSTLTQHGRFLCVLKPATTFHVMTA